MCRLKTTSTVAGAPWMIAATHRHFSGACPRSTRPDHPAFECGPRPQRRYPCSLRRLQLLQWQQHAPQQLAVPAPKRASRCWGFSTLRIAPKARRAGSDAAGLDVLQLTPSVPTERVCHGVAERKTTVAARVCRTGSSSRTTPACQWSFFSRNIAYVTPKIIYLHYLWKYFQDQSIPKIVNLILKKTSLLHASDSVLKQSMFVGYFDRNIVYDENKPFSGRPHWCLTSHTALKARQAGSGAEGLDQCFVWPKCRQG